MTSQVPTRQFQIDWFKIPFLGEAESVIKLGIKSRFSDVWLCRRDSVWDLLSLFKHLIKRPTRRVG